jgi:hypothetical protein
MPNYSKKERAIHVAMLLCKYEASTVKTNDILRKKAANSLVYWLSVYTARQISCAIDRYVSECTEIGVERRCMRRSYTFFDGNKEIHGFFESYISGKDCEPIETQANDCFQSFQSLGGCSDCLKGVLSYCNYCAEAFMTIHQTEVLVNFDFKGDENASTRTNKRKIVGNRYSLGEQQPIPKGTCEEKALCDVLSI